MFVSVLVGIYLLPFSQQSTPELFFSLCISSLLKGAARNKSITNVQVTHSEAHHPQVEEVLACLLTDLSVEERMRIERGQCTLESGLVCPCIEVLPISEYIALCNAWFGVHGRHFIAVYSLWH